MLYQSAKWLLWLNSLLIWQAAQCWADFCFFPVCSTVKPFKILPAARVTVQVWSFDFDLWCGTLFPSRETTNKQHTCMCMYAACKQAGTQWSLKHYIFIGQHFNTLVQSWHFSLLLLPWHRTVMGRTTSEGGLGEWQGVWGVSSLTCAAVRLQGFWEAPEGTVGCGVCV